MTMIHLTGEALFSLIKKHYPQASVQEETQQIYLVLKVEQKDYPVFLRIFDEAHLLQIIAFIPCSLDKATVNDMARLLHMLNKEIDVPGFGMDETSEIVFYRLMLPAQHKKMDSEQILEFLRATEQVCGMFTPPIEAIASGQLTLEEIMKKAQELEGES